MIDLSAVSNDDMRWLLVVLAPLQLDGICYNSSCEDGRLVPHLTRGELHPIKREAK